jgi:hypothetical protein
MNLTAINGSNPNAVNQGVDTTIQNPVGYFPEELVLKIFSYLNLNTLGTISNIRQWKELVNGVIELTIRREMAFGNDKWAQYFGEDAIKDEDRTEEFSSLPLNDFIADCRKIKSVFPEKKARDSLMLVRLPKTLNGGLTLTSLGELAKKSFPTATGYRNIRNDVVTSQGHESIDKSRWVIMTKDVLSESRNKSWAEQLVVVANLAQKGLNGYLIPMPVEAAACILAQYFDSSIRLFGSKVDDIPATYMRFKDNVTMGNFDPTGLVIQKSALASSAIGVAVLQRF